MAGFPPFHARPLDPTSTKAALALAAGVGAEGVYVLNAMLADQGEAIGCWGRDELLGCVWFGPRGNLVVLQREDLCPERTADAVQRARWPWRIALGPAATIDALARRLSGPPLVLRDQVYYGAERSAAQVTSASAAARPAQVADRELLMAAALELNREDLRVEPRRVDRRWLADMVDARIADGSTLVLGAPGRFACKLDLGSVGEGGLVLEGVFTFGPERGRGAATALVAAAMASASVPFVCLHVAVDNATARRSYARAGLLELQRRRLLLSG